MTLATVSGLYMKTCSNSKFYRTLFMGLAKYKIENSVILHIVHQAFPTSWTTQWSRCKNFQHEARAKGPTRRHSATPSCARLMQNKLFNITMVIRTTLPRVELGLRARKIRRLKDHTAYERLHN